MNEVVLKKYIAAIILLLCCTYLLHLYNAPLVQGEWDNGVIWFILQRSFLGHIPNIDFISGYPGLFEILFGSILQVIGFNYLNITLFQCFFWLAYLASGYYLSRCVFDSSVSIVLASIVAMLGYGVVIALSPGNVVQLLSLVVLAELLKCFKWQTPYHFLFFGIVLGSSFLFKQSGIFLICATYSAILCYIALITRHKNFSTKIIICSFSFMPLLGFMSLRFSLKMPIENGAVLLPWLISQMYILFLIFTPSLSLLASPNSLKTFTLRYRNFILIGVGSLLSVIYFPIVYGQAHAVQIIKELLFYYPQLIDLHVETYKFNPFCVILVILLYCSGWLLGLTGLSILRSTASALGLSVLAVVLVTIWFKVIVPNDLEFLLQFTNWWIVIMWLNKKLRSDPKSAMALTFGSIIIATAWPYPSGEFLSGIFLFLLVYTFYQAFLQRTKNSELDEVGSKLVYFLFALFTVAILYGQINKVLILKKNHKFPVSSSFANQLVVSYEREQRFLELASKLQDVIPAGAVVAGYPNMSFTLIAGGFLVGGLYGNFYGDIDGYIKFIDQINDDENISFVIVNSDIWPYSKSFPYFFDPMHLLIGIDKNFNELIRFNGFILMQRKVYK